LECESLTPNRVPPQAFGLRNSSPQRESEQGFLPSIKKKGFEAEEIAVLWRALLFARHY
jgi:hypothetical protein